MSPKKNTHRRSKEAPSTMFSVQHKIFAPSRSRGACDLMRARVRAQAPLAVAFRRLWLSQDWNAHSALSGDTSRVGNGFHWACRLITCALIGAIQEPCVAQQVEFLVPWRLSFVIHSSLGAIGTPQNKREHCSFHQIEQLGDSDATRRSHASQQPAARARVT